MNKFSVHNLKVILICLGISILFACSSQKDNAVGRSMQNLTARYNYIYNSKVILYNYETQLQEDYADNYSQILPVYVTPEKFNPSSKELIAAPVNSKDLDDVMTKAQTIISEKSFSNYIDDAYLLLGKAQFFKGNYFIATEYFDYIINNFKTGTPNYTQALDWKARSLMQRNDLIAAAKVLDALAIDLDQNRKNTAEPLATFAQMSINLHRNKEAISYLEAAIKKSNNKNNSRRWTYILAQLFEEEKNYEQALKAFVRVQKSNASFELYFNANLNRIKLYALLNGQKVDRKQQLKLLLKDDKNADYIDQIYFHIAESYMDDSNYKKAEDYYKLSVSNSTKNQYQKGLSYLKIADLNFKYFNKYLKAKAYYDSTVNTLPKNYPDYDLILKKDQNLEYLTQRYKIISLQDTLQALAKLPEAARKDKIQALFTIAEKQNAAADIPQTANNPFQNTNTTSGTQQTTGTFYFSNISAISKGYSDFKKRWGNRKREDNWRQSIRASGQTNTQYVAALDNTDLPKNPDDSVQVSKDTQTLIKEYTASVPVTPELLTASNEKIIDAYFEMAGFYQQELEEPAEAVRIYQILLDRFPGNKHLAAINYSLYLAFKDKDQARADTYKNVVLSKFPASIYAKTITDPSFSLKQSALDAAIIEKYNGVFEQYEKKDFPLVIKEVNDLSNDSAKNHLSPQFAYLKAIAIGRTNNVDSLINAFKEITSDFPSDKLIVPLIKDHLAYIDQHLAEFKRRKIALTDFDPNEPRFISQQPLQQETTVNNKKAPVASKGVTEPIKTIAPATITTTNQKPVTAAAPVKTSGIFNTSPATIYYFVIDIADASLTLSSSRFGIGQFNRGNYADNNLRHQLTEFDDDQLIYIGNFSNFEEVKIYADQITPQLKQIMKVPVTIYKSFIISKENFDKLTSRELLTQYLEFYKNNY